MTAWHDDTPAQPIRAFTMAEHALIAAWVPNLPRGLQPRIALDHEQADEVLELHEGDWTLPRWFVAPAPAGTVELISAMGSVEVLGTLGAALARVLEEEAAG